MLVEQNVAQSLEVADQAHVLENGVITLSGAAQDIAADPELRRSYLGL
jgi:branched-chain amino acid transport system ATP-binding protein